MLVDVAGRPLSSARYGEQVDGFQLPDGAVISKSASFALHNRIKNDSNLREKLIAAQKITGRKILHLSLLDNSNQHLNAGVNSAIEKNLDFGEKIQKQRIKDEKLTESGKGYEQLKIA